MITWAFQSNLVGEFQKRQDCIDMLRSATVVRIESLGAKLEHPRSWRSLVQKIDPRGITPLFLFMFRIASIIADICRLLASLPL